MQAVNFDLHLSKYKLINLFLLFQSKKFLIKWGKKMNGITVKEALLLLQPYGVELKAGKSGLSNMVQSVSVLEYKHYYNWLEGGEFFLSRLDAFETEKDFHDLIKKLGQVKSAALAIHLVNSGKFPLNEMACNLAEEYCLPIILLPRKMLYSTVFSIVLGAILDRQKILLEKSQTINTYLTDILLTGGGFENIAVCLNRILGNPVLIFSNCLEILAEVGIDQELKDNLIKEICNKIKKDKPTLPGTKIESEKSLSLKKWQINASNKLFEVVSAQIIVETEPSGYVAVISSPNIELEIDTQTIALTHAVTAVALEESKQRAVKKIEQKLCLDFIDDLLNERYESEEAILYRAKHLGFDLNSKHLVIVVEIDQFKGFYLKHLDKGEAFIQEIEHRLFRIVEFVVLAISNKSIVIQKSDKIVILPHISDKIKEEQAKSIVFKMAEDIIKEVNTLYLNISVSIGIGGWGEKIRGIASSYRQAIQALTIGRRVKGNNGIFDFPQLAIYTLLGSFDSSQFKESCKLTLSKLLEYDHRNSTGLIKTMETFLDSNESIIETANKLYLHPNTIKYRLSRIKKILGEDPFIEGERKLNYYIALKSIKVL